MSPCTGQSLRGPEKFSEKYPARWTMKNITSVYPAECQTCMIRGQCSGLDKQVLTAKGRCKYYEGAECEEIFRGWSMDLRSPAN